FDLDDPGEPEGRDVPFLSADFAASDGFPALAEPAEPEDFRGTASPDAPDLPPAPDFFPLDFAPLGLDPPGLVEPAPSGAPRFCAVLALPDPAGFAEELPDFAGPPPFAPLPDLAGSPGLPEPAGFAPGLAGPPDLPEAPDLAAPDAAAA